MKTANNIEIDGIVKSLAQWSRLSGVDRGTIRYRYEKGIRGKELLAPPKEKNVKYTLNEEAKAIIEDKMGLIYKCWHYLKRKYNFLDEEELYDCCVDAAIYAAKDFDESKGKFSTLLYVTAKNAALKKIRYWDSQGRKGTKHNLSLDYQFKSDNEEEFIERYLGVDDEHEFIDADVVEKVFSVLTKREKEIMYMFIFEEMQKKEIADEIGVSPNTVGRDIKIAKEKILGNQQILLGGN